MRRKTTFAELMADCDAMDARLNHSGQEFFHPHAAEYSGHARRITLQVMMANIPPDTDRDEWRRKAERVAERVADQVMLDGGYMISLASSAATIGALDKDKTNRPPEQVVTHDQVVQWVKDGHDGKPGGKIWKQIDFKRYTDSGGGDKGYKAIATIVMRAYYSQEPLSSYVRLRRAIQRYLHEGVEENNPLLDAIAEAWMAFFSVKYPSDLESHVTKIVRAF